MLIIFYIVSSCLLLQNLLKCHVMQYLLFCRHLGVFCILLVADIHVRYRPNGTMCNDDIVGSWSAEQGGRSSGPLMTLGPGEQIDAKATQQLQSGRTKLVKSSVIADQLRVSLAATRQSPIECAWQNCFTALSHACGALP